MTDVHHCILRQGSHNNRYRRTWINHSPNQLIGCCVALAVLMTYALPISVNAKDVSESDISLKMLRLNHGKNNSAGLDAHLIRPALSQAGPNLESIFEPESLTQRYTDDIEKWTRIIKHDPKNVAAYKARSEAFERRGANRADVCYALRDFKAATTDYTKAMALNAEEASAYGAHDVKYNHIGAGSQDNIIVSALPK